MDDRRRDARFAYPTDADIDEVLAEFGGDQGNAIGALLKDLAMLAGDYEASVSQRYVMETANDTPYQRLLKRG